MFTKNSKILFFILLVFSTIMAISSSSWLNAWICLEINMMSIIPIMLLKNEFSSISGSIKYFLTQAIASMFIVVVFLFFYNKVFLNLLNINNESLLLALSLKSGMPPFHFWLPQVIESVNNFIMFMLLSWQKIAPFMFISYCVCGLLCLLILSSAMVGAISAFNQNSFKKILTYSSMIHGAWMFMAMIFKQNMWMLYFLIYNLSLLLMCFIMEKVNIKKISDMINMLVSEKFLVLFSLNILSMAGLPPFMGFFMKFMILYNVFYNIYFVILTFIVMFFSFLSIYFYLKMGFNVFILNQKKVFKKKYVLNNSNILIIFFLMNLCLPVLLYMA